MRARRPAARRVRTNVYLLDTDLPQNTAGDRMLTRHQQREPTEQVFQPQVRADAFVERVFVQDHGAPS